MSEHESISQNDLDAEHFVPPEAEALEGLDDALGNQVEHALIQTISEPAVLPVVASKIEIFTDHNGEQWVYKRTLEKRVFRRILANKDKIRINTGKAGILINLADAKSIIDFETLPQADPHTGIYTDENGAEWVNLFGLGGTDYSFVKRNLERVRSINGRSNTHNSILFNKQDVDALLNNRDELPIVDFQTGVYINENGEEWISEIAVGTKAWNQLKRNKDSIRNIKGRGVNYRGTVLFNLQDAKDIIASITKIPLTNPDTGVYIDENGEEWISAKTMGKFDAIVRTHTSDIRFIKGRSRYRNSNLYSKKDVEKFLTMFNSLPLVDPDTGVYIDENGEEWVSNKGLSRNDYYIAKNRKKNIRTLKGKSNFREAVLYSKRDLGSVLSQLNNLPTPESETGIYIDSEGNKWFSKKALGSTYQSIKEKSEAGSVRSMEGRMGSLFFYNDFTQYLNDRANLPTIDRVTGYYTDDNGDEWISKKALGEDYYYVKNNKDKIRVIRGRDGSNKSSDLYNKSDVANLIDEKRNTILVYPDKADEMMMGLEEEQV